MSEGVIIHIVDDEEPVRKSLAFLLTMSDHAVRVHESATAFLAIAPGSPVPASFTDLRMPDNERGGAPEEAAGTGCDAADHRDHRSCRRADGGRSDEGGRRWISSRSRLRRGAAGGDPPGLSPNSAAARRPRMMQVRCASAWHACPSASSR